MKLRESARSGDVDESPEVTFLLPCLNEEESLPTVLSEIRSLSWFDTSRTEILVADNGSSDQSVAVALEKGARVVHVPIRGYGAALMAGIDNARGNIVVMGDADGSYKFSDSLQMIQMIRAGSDLVMGDRFAGGIAPGAMPWLHRWLGNPLLSGLGRLIYRLPIRDFHCGLRAFDREAIKSLGLESTGMEFASEMIIKSAQAGLIIGQVPVTLGPDLRSRSPHLRTWADGLRHLKLLLKYRPVWIFAPILLFSCMLLVFALVLGLLGPTELATRELSVRSVGAILSVSLVLLVTLCAFEVVRIGQVKSSASSVLVENRRTLLWVIALVSLVSSVGIVQQTQEWFSGIQDPEVQLASVMWFFLYVFGVTASLIALVFILLANLVKKSS